MRTPMPYARVMSRQVAGDVDYDRIGAGYAVHRRPDPRIEALIQGALGDARTVLNVGAGAGSYEPADRHVIAVEPAAAMRRQRPRHLAPAINARAEALPLDDQSVDASMAIVTVHQWQDLDAGIAEMIRVTRGPIVVVGFDGEALQKFWLNDYAPELFSVARRRDPTIDRLVAILSAAGRTTLARPIALPIDCIDGVVEAYYARPECFLDPHVTRAQSTWAFVSDEARARCKVALAADLHSGEWDRRYGHYRAMPAYESSMRMLVSTPL